MNDYYKNLMHEAQKAGKDFDKKKINMYDIKIEDEEGQPNDASIEEHPYFKFCMNECKG